jgi:hypothetical protein
MKCLVVFIVLPFYLAATAQKNKESFSLMVLQPDTAILDGSLQAEVKTIEQDQQEKYNTAVSQMELVMNTGYPKEMEKQMSRTRDEIKKSLLQLKERHPGDFKYFHLLSSELTEECIRHFADNPSIKITESKFIANDTSALKNLCDQMNCDFVVYFSDIKGKAGDHSPVLTITTSVYSKKDNTVIYSQPAEVCCDDKQKGALSSLLRDAALSSFGQIIALLKERS